MAWVGWSRVLPLAAMLPAMLLPAASRASHCTYCNHGLPSDVSFKTLGIGTDGVVVIALDDAWERVLDQSSWDITTVTVLDSEGQEVPGTLETHVGFAAGAWRPDAPWIPGTYEVSVHVDLPSFDDPDVLTADCPPYTRTADVTVINAPRHEVGTQTLMLTETYRLDPIRSLETIVCCDGALPWLRSLEGHGCPGSSKTIDTSGGYCTELAGTGVLTVSAVLLIDGNEANATYTMREVTSGRRSASGDASVSVELEAPKCLEFEVLDLVTRETSVISSCHGDDIAEELGMLELDPSSELDDECEGPAFVCEVKSDSWDRYACATWPDGMPYDHPSTVGGTSGVPLPEEEPAPPDDGGEEDSRNFLRSDGCGPGACRVQGKGPTPWLWLIVGVLIRGRRFSR